MSREIKSFFHSSHGSVMMEYLIVNLGIFIVIAMAAHFFLPAQSVDMPVYELDNSGNISFVQTETVGSFGPYGQYGRIGNAFLQHYETTLKIISMPFP